jgi:hypothetical protein
LYLAEDAVVVYVVVHRPGKRKAGTPIRVGGSSVPRPASIQGLKVQGLGSRVEVGRSSGPRPASIQGLKVQGLGSRVEVGRSSGPRPASIQGLWFIVRSRAGRILDNYTSQPLVKF